MFLIRPPRPPLDRCITVLWVCRQSSQTRRLERVLPTGTAQLIVNLAEDETRNYDPSDPSRCERGSGAVIAGPSARYGIIDTDEQAHVVGACFTQRVERQRGKVEHRTDGGALEDVGEVAQEAVGDVEHRPRRAAQARGELVHRTLGDPDEGRGQVPPGEAA